MRWRAKDPFAWKVAFAWLPVTIDKRTIWLERYLRRFACTHYEVAFLHGPDPEAKGYDKRITDLAAIAAKAAGSNARCAPQLLLGDITFALADAVEDGRIVLGRKSRRAA